MSLVRVARIADLVEAKVIASALEAGGIYAFVQDGEIGQTYSLLQPAIGGFGIMVSEEDAAEATVFIREHRSANPIEPDAVDDAAEAADDAEGGETWTEGRARRRNLPARWFIVAFMVGPLAIAFRVLTTRLVVTMLAAVLDG